MKILVGYVQSKVGDIVIRRALKNAKAFGAQVYLVTILPQSHDLAYEEINQAETQLETIKSEFEEEGISCEPHTIVSNRSRGEALVEFARENRVDEIVIGVRKRSRVGKMLTGSTAQYIILNAPCSVTLANPAPEN